MRESGRECVAGRRRDGVLGETSQSLAEQPRRLTMDATSKPFPMGDSGSPRQRTEPLTGRTPAISHQC